MNYCGICGKLASYNTKTKRWNKTCGSKECLHKSHQIAQSIGIKNKTKIIIDKDILYNMFIIQNLPRYEIAKYFKCSEANIKKWLRKYNISKPQQSALKNTFKTKQQKFNDPYYNNMEKSHNTNLQKYGVKSNLQLLSGNNYKSQSKGETKWLNELNIHNRQYIIKYNNHRYKVDGYDPQTNTIYEYLGDYWHGNPYKYKDDDVNKRLNKTMGELYQNTVTRFNILKSLGYKIIYRWESSDNDEEY